ncbi:MAG: CBS domain-containing protein [Methanomicrobiaceae archaeon]|nr:CBS domain-containing protein [Methanomicrobiaceae archaeon]
MAALELEDIPVVEIMHTDFASVHPDTPVGGIFQSFSRRGCQDIIVCDEKGEFQGIITELDLLSAIAPGVGVRSRRKMGCLECIIKSGAKSAGEVMSREHITVSREASVAQAMVAMEKYRHPDVIVVDDEGLAVGIVEMCDVIAFLIRHDAL